MQYLRSFFKVCCPAPHFTQRGFNVLIRKNTDSETDRFCVICQKCLCSHRTVWITHYKNFLLFLWSVFICFSSCLNPSLCLCPLRLLSCFKQRFKHSLNMVWRFHRDARRGLFLIAFWYHSILLLCFYFSVYDCVCLAALFSSFSPLTHTHTCVLLDHLYKALWPGCSFHSDTVDETILPSCPESSFWPDHTHTVCTVHSHTRPAVRLLQLQSHFSFMFRTFMSWGKVALQSLWFPLLLTEVLIKSEQPTTHPPLIYYALITWPKQRHHQPWLPDITFKYSFCILPCLCRRDAVTEATSVNSITLKS